MFTNDLRQKERTGNYGSSRVQYLQELVSQFQNASDEETKEKIVANLANFAYDPYNYTFLRQLNVFELFLDCLTEPNEKLVEFGVGGICNACADPRNAAVIVQCGGIPLVIQCLSSPVRNTTLVSFIWKPTMEDCDLHHHGIGERHCSHLFINVVCRCL